MAKIKFYPGKALLLAACLMIAGMQAAAFSSSHQAMHDSVIKYGVHIEPYLKGITGNQIKKDFNYAPYINKFLKENQYVVFPSYMIPVGLDATKKQNKHNYVMVQSGNRLFFPSGGGLKTLPTERTNGFMVFIGSDVRDVYIYGLHIDGAKSNPGYKTSPYGAGIAMYAPSNIVLRNILIQNSTGDGLTVRVNWNKQSENIYIDNLEIKNSTRVGMLINGIVNGTFKNITIESTGEKKASQILKPQTALSFEPNDCTSQYINCKISNLKTKNNYGPVVATANFGSMLNSNSCNRKIDITIDGWEDFNDDPACYGSTFDFSTYNISKRITKYNQSKLSGTFTVNNAKWYRKSTNKKYNGYFVFNNNQDLKSGVRYRFSNVSIYEWENNQFIKHNNQVKIKATPNVTIR